MNKLSLIIVLVFISGFLMGQNLDDLVFADEKNKPTAITADFKTTSVVNSHTIRGAGQNELLFSVKHRFANFSLGHYDLFGFDIMQSARIGFEYGILDNLTVGIGRSTLEKTVDGFVKYRFITQKRDGGGAPISVAFVVGSDIKTNRWKLEGVNYPSASGMSYFYQILIARKFSDRISIQIIPGLVHQNMVKLSEDPNDTWVTGVSGRFKISSRISFNAEYFYVYNPPVSVEFINPLSLGFSFDTGGHIFQVNFSNAPAMTERHIFTQTAGSWLDGDFALGFSIYRTFSF